MSMTWIIFAEIAHLVNSVLTNTNFKKKNVCCVFFIYIFYCLLHIPIPVSDYL